MIHAWGPWVWDTTKRALYKYTQLTFLLCLGQFSWDCRLFTLYKCSYYNITSAERRGLYVFVSVCLSVLFNKLRRNFRKILTRLTLSYYGTLFRSWHRWLCGGTHILPRRTPQGLELFSCQSYVQIPIQLSVWPAADHSCYQQTTTVVTPRLLSTVDNRMRPLKAVVNRHSSVALTTPPTWRRSRARCGPASYCSSDIDLLVY